MRAPGPPRPGGFTPDPQRLYEVGRNGRPYTLDRESPVALNHLEARVRWWWVASILVNSFTMGIAAAAAMLAPRAMAAWCGLLSLAAIPLLFVPPALRRRGLRRSRHVHRRRPNDFPPPDRG